MIFLPNKFERYTAALRNYIHISVLKYGILPEHLTLLRKIHTAEALFSYKEKSPVNLNDFANKLFLAVYTKLLEKKTKFRFSVEVNSNFIFSEKTLEALLLNLCRTAEKIQLAEHKGKIIIECSNCCRLSERLVKALNAVCFYEIKTEKLLICISAEATDKKSESIKREWDISNPFSPVNIYLT